MDYRALIVATTIEELGADERNLAIEWIAAYNAWYVYVQSDVRTGTFCFAINRETALASSAHLSVALLDVRETYEEWLYELPDDEPIYTATDFNRQQWTPDLPF